MPKPLSQAEIEKIAEIEKSRAISDAGLLKEAAEFNIDEKGEKELELTKEQKERIKAQAENPELWAIKQEIIDAVENSIQGDDFASNEALAVDNPKLWNDPYFANNAIKINPNYLEYFSPEIRSDKDVVLNAVREDGLTLKFTSPGLQDNEDVVIAAVEQNYEAYQYCSERLKGEYDSELRHVYRMEKLRKHGSLDPKD